MKYNRQQLIDSGFFAKLRNGNDEFIQATSSKDAAGTLVNRRYGYKEIVGSRIMNGCIALLLGEDDDVARTYFSGTVPYALKLIGAQASGGGPRIYEVNVDLSEAGGRVTGLHEKKPQPGQALLTITDFYTALLAAGAFGERPQFQVVASIPEAAYRNPDVMAAAPYWAYVRALKALLLSDDASARREAAVALASDQAMSRSEAAALLALLADNQEQFQTHLKEAVRLYSKMAAKQQNDPRNAIFLPGLMLCRVAIDRGLTVGDGPYLPVRLLPNYNASPQ